MMTTVRTTVPTLIHICAVRVVEDPIERQIALTVSFGM